MRTIAPAKINWTLEVLGRRDDGYHEIRSVMQTIDLCDEVRVWPEADLRQSSELPRVASEDGPLLSIQVSPIRVHWGGDDLDMAPENDFGFRAAALLDPEQSRDASIDLKKSIPVAAGLGGGSSDEAAVLRALDRMWNLGSSRQRLTKLAAELGSDVAFFLSGGTALAEGRGEYVTPLPDAPDAWLVLLVPPMKLAEKTKRMYEAITAKDFSDGSRTESLSRALREGKQVGKAGLYNAFERRAYGFFDGLAGYRDALLSAGASLVHLAGAGPTLFALADGEASAREIANRVRAPDARVFVARTMGAEEATAVTD